MRYLIAILLPPLGMLLCGKFFQAILCLLLMLTVVAWPVASLWAVLVAMNWYADRRTDRLIKEMRQEMKT